MLATRVYGYKCCECGELFTSDTQGTAELLATLCCGKKKFFIEWLRANVSDVYGSKAVIEHLAREVHEHLCSLWTAKALKKFLETCPKYRMLEFADDSKVLMYLKFSVDNYEKVFDTIAVSNRLSMNDWAKIMQASLV